MDALTLRTIFAGDTSQLEASERQANEIIDRFVNQPRRAVELDMVINANGEGARGGRGGYGGNPERIRAAMAAKLEHDSRISQQRQQAIESEGAARRQAIAQEAAARREAQNARHLQTIVEQEERHQQRLNQIAAQAAAQQQHRGNQGQQGTRFDALQRQGYYNVAAGGMMTGFITAPLAGAAVGATKFGSDFESAMQHVIALTDVTRGELQGLKRDVLALSNDELINQGPAKLADALYYVTSTGLKGAEGMTVLRSAALGASADLGTSAVVANTLTTVLDAYGLEADQAAKATDILTEAVKQGKGEADAYASSFPKVIALAAQAGVSFSEVAAQMASATRVGLTPSESATALRQIFSNLIDPSEKAKRAMAEMKTSAQEIRAMLREQGLFNTLKDLSERTGGRVGPISELFGSIRALTGFLSTTGTGTLKEYQRTLNAIENSQGATAEAAATNSETLRFQMEKLKNMIEETGVEVSNHWIPRVTPMVKMLRQDIPGALDAAFRAWDALPTPVKASIAAFTGFLVLAGPMKMAVGNLQIMAAAVGSMISVLGRIPGAAAAMAPLLAFASNPAVIALVGGTLVAAGAVAWMRFQEHLTSIAKAEKDVEENSRNLARSLQTALSAASGNRQATNVVEDLSKSVEAAGKDVNKLAGTLDEVSNAKRQVKAMDIDPAAKAALIQEMEAIASRLESRIIKVQVEMNEKSKGFWQTFTEDLNEVSGGWLGVAPVRPIQPKQLPRTPAIMPDVQRFDVGAMNTLQKAMLSGSIDKLGTFSQDERTDVLKRAVTEGDFHQLKKIRDYYIAEFKKNPLYVFGDGERQQYAAVVDRLQKLARTRKEAADKAAHDAKLRAQDEADALKAMAEENAERLRRIEIQRLQSLGTMWQSFGNQAETALGGFQQGGDPDHTREMAARAAMAKREFAEIPPHLRNIVIGLGAIGDQMNRLTKHRDQLRDLFGDMFRDAVENGTNPAAVAAMARAYEKRLDYEQRMKRLDEQGKRAGAAVINEAEGHREAIAQRVEQLREAGRKTGETYKADVFRAPVSAQGRASYGGVQPHVAESGHRIENLFGLHNIGGVGSRGNVSDHPGGRALDFMTKNKEMGDQIADYFIQNAQAEAVKYVIWRQRIWSPEKADQGWRAMKDRGSATANHFDHVHVSYRGGRGQGDLTRLIPRETNTGQRIDAVPEMPSGQPSRPYTPAPSPEYEGALLGMGLPKTWKPVTQYGMAPGETRAWQMRVQELLMDKKAAESLAQDLKFPSVEAMAKDFQPKAVARDQANAIAAVHDQTAQAIRAMGRDIRLLGRENNPYLVLLEELEHGASRLLNPAGKRAVVEMTLGLMVERMRQGTKEFRREVNSDVGTIREAAPSMGNAAEYDRARFAAEQRRQIWNSEDVRNLFAAAEKLKEEGKILEANAKLREVNRQTAERLALALMRYDAQAAESAQRSYEDQRRTQMETNSMLEFRTQKLLGGTNAADTDIEAQVEQARRDALRGLEGAIASGPGLTEQLAAGKISREQAMVKAQEAADRKRAELMVSGRNSFLVDESQFSDQHSSQMGQTRYQRELAGMYRANDPRLQIEMQMVQREYELRAQNNARPEGQRQDEKWIEKRLQALREEITGQSELQRFQTARNNALEAENALLNTRKEFELALAHSSAQRLEIEYRYADLLNQQAGIQLTPEEAQARRDTMAQAKANDAQRALLDFAQQFRSQVSDSVYTGMKEGIGKGAKSFITSMADSILREGADALAAKWTNSLFRKRAGGDVVEEKPVLGGILGAGGQNSPKWLPFPEKYPGIPGRDSTQGESIKSALQSQRINYARIIVTSGRIDAPGSVINAGGGGGLPFGLFGGGGGQGSGSQPSQEQFFDSVGDGVLSI